MSPDGIDIHGYDQQAHEYDRRSIGALSFRMDKVGGSQHVGSQLRRIEPMENMSHCRPATVTRGDIVEGDGAANVDD